MIAISPLLKKKKGREGGGENKISKWGKGFTINLILVYPVGIQFLEFPTTFLKKFRVRETAKHIILSSTFSQSLSGIELLNKENRNQMKKKILKNKDPTRESISLMRDSNAFRFP